jgi:hypothetical protein
VTGKYFSGLFLGTASDGMDDAGERRKRTDYLPQLIN